MVTLPRFWLRRVDISGIECIECIEGIKGK
mgnify:CR=1 FL=1